MDTEIGPEIEEKMVSAETNIKGVKGGGSIRWQPGQSGNPVGRPKKADERAVLSALDKALPPDKLTEALQDALAWAYEYKSWKGVLAISQFVVAYQVGSPVQRSVSATGKLDAILQRLSSMDEGGIEAVEAAMRNGDAIEL